MSDEDTALSWSGDIHEVLEDVLHNCNELQKEHKSKYQIQKKRLSYFRIPVITLSSINSVFSVGLSNFISQEKVSVINCVLSLIVGIVGAIELFLGINRKQEQALMSYHGYKLLSTKISTELKISPVNRKMEGMDFLTEVMDEYRKLFETSNVLRKSLHDKLIEIRKAPHVLKHKPIKVFKNPLNGDIELDVNEKKSNV